MRLGWLGGAESASPASSRTRPRVTSSIIGGLVYRRVGRTAIAPEMPRYCRVTAGRRRAVTPGEQRTGVLTLMLVAAQATVTIPRVSHLALGQTLHLGDFDRESVV